MNRVFAPDERLFGEGQWPPAFGWPNDFRKLMFWLFAFTALSTIGVVLYTIPHHRKFSFLQNLLGGPLFLVPFAALNGIAAWTIWKAHLWARAWSIAASSMYLVFFVRPFIVLVRPTWDHHLLPLSAGLLGIACFAWPDRNPKPTYQDSQSWLDQKTHS